MEASKLAPLFPGGNGPGSNDVNILQNVQFARICSNEAKICRNVEYGIHNQSTHKKSHLKCVTSIHILQIAC